MDEEGMTMDKRQAQQLARKIAAEVIDHAIDSGIAYDAVVNDGDADKVQDALKRLVRIIEYPRERSD